MSNGFGPIQLPYAAFQLVIDGVASGDLVIQRENVIRSTGTGNILAIGGTVLGRNFVGTFSEPTETFAAWAPVLGIWQWRFQGVLKFNPGAAICAGDDLYLLEGAYAIYSAPRLGRQHFGVHPGEVSSSPGEPTIEVAQGSWYASACFPSIGP
jgi:hypothetical protein